jgi:hypothetical protein
MGKEKRKIKRKGVSCLAGSGGDLAHLGATARARLRPSWPSSEGETAGDGAVARARMPGRGRGLTALTATEGGGVRPESGRRRNPATVLRRWSGSTAGRRWRGTGGCRGSWG